MSGNSWTLVAIALLALLLMAGAAIVESSAGQISRQRLWHGGAGRERSVQGLLEPHRSLSSALRLVQVICIAVAASLITFVIARGGGQGAVVVAIVVVSLASLVFGQALPRALARARPLSADGRLAHLTNVVAALVHPLSSVSDGVASLFSRLLGGDRPDLISAGLEDEILLRSRSSDDDGIIEPEERAMIDNVLHLEETHAHDIMVPRVDIVAVDEDASPREVVKTITVYRESIDHIVGILYAKDLLPFVIGSTRTLPLKSLVRPAYVVPESKPIDDLLTELRRNRVHIAIVADEYGGTAGLVTIEDILEEIVGEIHDEYDEETTLLQYVNEREVIADGRLPIEEVEKALGLDLAGDENAFGTVAGFVHWHLDRLPQPGDRFSAQGVLAEVLEIEGHRLRQLRLIRLDDGRDEDAAGVETAGDAPPPLPAS